MEGEQQQQQQQHHYELRSRSRSRSHTPMVYNQTPADQELTDHHYDLRSRSRERSHTPGEVTSSRRSGTRSLPSSAGKQRDKSMEAIAEQKEESKTESPANSRNSRRSESTTSSVTRKVERRSERQRAKRQIFSNGQSEAKEDSSSDGKAEEKVKRKSITPRRMITSDYSSEEGEKEDPPSRPGSAYEIYKQAGDWWNVFPKTDYTYSEKSQCRYEIAPGVLAMPNMSRPSIHSDGNSTTGSVNSLSQQNLSQCSRGTRESFGEERSYDGGEARDTIEQNRINEMNACRLFAPVTKEGSAGRSVIYRKTHVEQYNSHREIIYEGSARSLTRDRYGGHSQVDSDTELDEAVSLRYASRQQQKWRVTSWMETIRLTIVTWLYSGLEVVNARILRRGNVSSSHDHHRYRVSRWRRAWAPVDRLMQYLYLLLVRILFLDTWLLSRASTARQQLKERRSKLLWLILLPPLLLAGFWFLSSARDAVSLLPVAKYAEKYWTERGVAPPPEEATEKADYTAADASEAHRQKYLWNVDLTDSGEVKRFIEHLAERLEKLEAAEISKTERLTNITETVKELRNTEKSVWDGYSDKLKKIEENLDEKNSERSSEIDAIKVEFQSLRELYAGLKTCCDTSAILASGEDVKEQVERAMAGYFGAGVSKQQLHRVVESLIVASENKETNNIVNSEASTMKGGETDCTTATSEANMRRIVSEVLKIYDADKTGRVDYALESAGGQIISTRCTQRYNVNTRAFKLLGFTLYYESNNPRTVIQGNSLQPGACWAFQDFPGYLLIKLRTFIRVTGFTVEHVPRSILPNSEMRSAPRKFNVWGLKDENDPDPVMFGDYEFLDSEDNLQYFPVQNTDIVTPYEYAELRIHSNHGQLEYTCLYRFRVHGIPI